jgi:hypothetical protein
VVDQESLKVYVFCLCDVTLSVYPHRAGLKNMPGHGGIRTYDLWNTSPCILLKDYSMFCGPKTGIYLLFTNAFHNSRLLKFNTLCGTICSLKTTYDCRKFYIRLAHLHRKLLFLDFAARKRNIFSRPSHPSKCCRKYL